MSESITTIAASLAIRPSCLDGLGVFSTMPIRKDTLLEEALLLPLPSREVLNNYIFEYEGLFFIGLGYASLYNHASEPNAGYVIDIDKKTIVIRASRDIAANEEIFISYGQDWFSSRQLLPKRYHPTPYLPWYLLLFLLSVLIGLFYLVL